MINDLFSAFSETLIKLIEYPLISLPFLLCPLLFIFKLIFRVLSVDSVPLFFGVPSTKSDPFKFADNVLNNSDLKKVFYSILERDLQYFQVWYSPNKRDIKKFKNTALFSFKCLLIELFYFDSDFEAISLFYESNSFDVVLFSTVLGEHPDLKYYHDLPDFFRTLVNDKDKIILLKEQMINAKK